MGHAFGKLVRERRERSGVPLRGLAEKLGISAAYLSEVERGWSNGPLTPDRIFHLVGVLGLSAVQTEELLAAAAEDRGAVRLSLAATSPSHLRFAARLERNWARLTEEQLQRLLALLAGKEEATLQLP